MDITTILSLAVVGAFSSVLVQFLKEVFGTKSLKTKLITVLVALIMGGVYYLATTFGFIESFVSILVTSSTVYAFLLKK